MKMLPFGHQTPKPDPAAGSAIPIPQLVGLSDPFPSDPATLRNQLLWLSASAAQAAKAGDTAATAKLMNQHEELWRHGISLNGQTAVTLREIDILYTIALHAGTSQTLKPMEAAQ